MSTQTHLLLVVTMVISLSLLPLLLATTDGETGFAGGLPIGDFDLFDLTYPFDNHTVYWPGVQKFVFTKKVDTERKGYRYRDNEFAAAEHGGTHLDAPAHFYRRGRPVGQLPLRDLFLSLRIIDVSTKVGNNPDYVLHLHDLPNLDSYAGIFSQPTLLVFKFGWSRFFNNRTKYLGLNESDNTLRFPGLSEEVAQWVVSQSNIRGIGVDVSSVDRGASKEFFVHRINAAAGIYNLENVKLTDDIPESGCTVLVAPMLVAQGSGAPVRILAMCPRRLVPSSFS